MPSGGKVWQGGTPAGMFLTDMGLITEAVVAVGGFGDVSFMETPVCLYVIL